MAGVSESIAKVCNILKAAKSDTEKFAALFMVTKLIRKDCSSASKKALFEAIGFKFLKKLLKAEDVPDDCPPSMYKSISLAVLTSFCQDEFLATHAEMIETIPIFMEIVQKADENEDDLLLVSEAYRCLQCIAGYEPGQKALLASGAVSKMSHIYSFQSFQTDEALNLLVTLATRFGPESWESDPKAFHTLLNKIALDFETDNDERKFELCTILSSLLNTCRRNSIVASLVGETWPESIYKGLNDILRSRIGKNQRDPALKLAASALEMLGVEWTLTDAENPNQFFFLLVQLNAIEVRMQMDGKSFNACVAQAELLLPCFVTLELALAYIGTDQLELEQKEKQQMYTALKGAFNAIFSVLTKLSADKISQSLAGKEKAFASAMVRILGAWLAQETTAMRPAIYKLLPFILMLANDSFYETRAYRLEHKGDPACSPADVLRLLLPAMCHLTVEEQARRIMIDSKQDEVLYECLAFHWSIAHYKRPPIPRAERLARMNEPEPEISKEQLEDMRESRAAIVSLCNIFMNVTVLEPKIVEESAVFATLLKFILNNLPELKANADNLVMHGHLAVLALLLLKQQAKLVKKNDPSIYSYLQSAIRFLWDAYIIDESNDPTALVVAMTYKEHWNEITELWFLGMQTMCALLPVMPWMSDFALESGWAEGIIETLCKVKIGTLPGNVKSAYEDFLGQLVLVNPKTAPILKKADALKACRNHRLMELGKNLFGD